MLRCIQHTSPRLNLTSQEKPSQATDQNLASYKQKTIPPLTYSCMKRTATTPFCFTVIIIINKIFFICKNTQDDGTEINSNTRWMSAGSGLIVFLRFHFASPNSSGTSGSNKTNLFTSGCSSFDRRRFTNVLMVTTSVGMLDGVHGHTSHLGPAVTLGLVLVVGATRLQDGLVDTTAAGDDADHGAVGGRDHFLGTRGQLDSGSLCVGIVSDDSGIVAGCSC
uniref:Uncharacterized protein n=2 Tax=Cacopsylla melanoneura TaxID=428564 RepID=A0A8D8XLN0_9HEMI